MSNTLRRKMFKLGGSANTHGVGITSGLKMNKGGRVGFQQGNVVRGGPFITRDAQTGGGILQRWGLGFLQADPNFQIGQNLPQEGGFLDPASFVTSEQLRQNLLEQSINTD